MRAHNQQFVRRLMTTRLFPRAVLFVGSPASAVVWYVHHRGIIIISCFVPADAV